MKTFKTFVGIDISKLTVDVSVFHQHTTDQIHHFKAPNHLSGIKQLLKTLKQQKINLNETLFCCENTGIYTVPLITILGAASLHFWVVSAIEIKRSQGIARGKNDQTDSKRIAFYAFTHLHKYEPSSLPQTEILQLKLLFTEREKVLKAIALFERTKENEGFIDNSIFKLVKKINDRQIKQLRKTLRELEAKMQGLIESDVTLQTQFQLLKSIPGIGPQTALYLIITTKSFQGFKTWRQMACYAGVAPFEYSSGTSIRGKTKVNSLADKKMKSMLQMCVLTAIKIDPEIKKYYQNKKQQGKASMLVMNNIRCKLLSRAFAVINRGTPFVSQQTIAA
ncbi:MAG TPA: IS110 family transposase [Parafilimonas sp.]|jgi:transposase|nr:IS110 family transposase [Parafilimonas sp.]